MLKGALSCQALLAIATLLAAVGPSNAQTTVPPYVIVSNEPRTGTLLKRTTSGKYPVPIKRSYEQLKPEEKAIVHSWYAHLGPGDEPPYPADGLAPLFNSIQSGQKKLMVRGDLELNVTIAPSGQATEVQVMKSPGYEMTEYASSVLLLAKYKPAVCKGKPCQMQFPVFVRFDPDPEDDYVKNYRPTEGTLDR